MYMIVDDDPGIQALLRHVLESAGYEFRSCLNGRSVLPAALAEKPDLILLDVGLPDITGIEVCRELKAEPETRYIPGLMITGQATAVDTRVEGLDMGAENYMFKPIAPDVLIARIGSMMIKKE